MVVGDPSEPSPSSVSTLWAEMDRSSRRGNERMRSKACEDGRRRNPTQSDLMMGENPWNGRRESLDPLRWPRLKFTTWGNPLIQPPTSASAAMTTWTQLTSKFSV